MKKIPIILSIDFDMTIVNSHPFPKINGFRKGAKKYINKLNDLGYYIIINTCRTNTLTCTHEYDAVIYLASNDVYFDQINKNHPATIKAFKNDSRKLGADIYIDDKGMWLFGIPSWFVLYWMIRFKSYFLKDNHRLLSHCISSI